MLKKIALFSLIIAVSFSVFAQSPASFKFIPEKAYNGKPITIMYDATGTILEGKPNVKAVVYQYINYKWDATDLKLSGTQNKWKADFNIPENCGLLGLKFVSDTLADNNHDNGYFIMMYDKDRAGAMAPGAYAGWGLARSPKYGKQIPEYIKFKGISDTATFHWLNQEISFNQQSKADLVVPYAISLKGFMGDGAVPKLKLALNYLTRRDANEDELLKARTISGTLLNDQVMKDSIENVLNQKFPKGSLARLAAYRKISANKEMPAILKASEQFLNDFPVEKTNIEFDKENFINYSKVYENILIIGMHLDKNALYLAKYINVLPYISLANLHYKLVEIPFKRKDQSPDSLYPISEILMKRYSYFMSNRPAEYSCFSPLEWREQVNLKLMFSRPVYISLLMSAGKDEQALEQAEIAQKYSNYKNATLNDLSASLLKKKGQTEKLRVLLEKSMFENQSTPEMVLLLKELFIRKNHTENGFEAYVERLKNPADAERAMKEAKESMINKTFPDWSMMDMNNNMVHFKDLRGKTIIMDFWATWCVPCKASFPGMKIAVERYKKDPNVVFYFVDTEERTASYKEEVRKYIKDNNYPFNILFDNKIEGAQATGEVFDRICKAFQISGIPQKLFIDKNGMLRFISLGYKGSATALADDISVMVEMTKEAK